MAFDKRHIENIFDQKFSLADQQELIKYFEDKEFNEETRKFMTDQWMQFNPDQKNEANLDHVFYKMLYSISEKELSSQKKNLFFRVSQIAAILIAGILIASGIYFSGNKSNNEDQQQIEFISKSGFRNQFRLPDGTTGWLGYGSDLKYHADHNKRVVDLNGLAFFDVTRHEGQPFLVNTPASLNIEVLGTRFNVSAYSDDHSCEIVLERGHIKIRTDKGNVAEMRSNDRVFYDSKNNSIQKSKVTVSDYLAWKDGKLVLNDVSLNEACMKISRFYNVEVDLQAKNIDNQKIRLVLENETLKDALTLLTMISPVKYKIEERKALGNNSYSKQKVIIKNK